MSELTFEQMLEESLKTIRNGEVVDGTVIDVKPDEIVLNIGYKADGIITRNEYSNQSGIDLRDVVKEGDKMNAKVLKVNDGEGQVLLTYKRLAQEKGSKRLEEAYENIGKLKEAGMKYSALLMLGIGGKGHSKESVEATAALLNKYPPYRVSPLSTAVLRGSELEELCDKGEYVQLTERELVEEEKMLLRALKINDCIFFGSHPYNLITISGVLPQDREEIIKHLDSEMAAWDRDQPGFLDTVWKRTDM